MGESQTFLFADLASYTALTEIHGDDEAVRLVEDYCDGMRRLLPEHGGHEVKAIGDALLVRVPHARDAVQLGIARRARSVVRSTAFRAYAWACITGRRSSATATTSGAR